MKRKTIAVDLDDVLAYSAAAFVAYSNKQWGTTLEVDDFTEHWAEMWGISIEETLKRRDRIYKDRVQVELDVMTDAKEALTRLADRFNLIIVTARPLVLQKGTLEWLDQYYKGVFSDVHFAGIWDTDTDHEAANKMTKAKIIKELGADYFIDDHPKHCFAVAAEGVPTVLFGDYKWSRGLTLPDGVTRVANWAEVEDYFRDK
ncbi:hypothetical protein EKI60_04440 [Candidatus Saccharibacteria bacterium]|nr:MAG: hypothetical protein EKI60_04440 [Candidatus Saccharibacteria bacterium]